MNNNLMQRLIFLQVSSHGFYLNLGCVNQSNACVNLAQFMLFPTVWSFKYYFLMSFCTVSSDYKQISLQQVCQNIALFLRLPFTVTPFLMLNFCL